MNLSTRPFKFGDATGRALVRMPFAFRVATNSLVNLVSRSCIRIEGFSARPAVCSMNASVCFTTQRELGARCPCYSCAPGKVLVAFLPSDERDETVSRIEFKRFTATIITSKRQFRQELDEICERGFAVDRGEGLAGVHCVAAPIFDRHASPVAAITITGPSHRIPQEKFEAIGKIVRDGARLASEEFNRH